MEKRAGAVKSLSEVSAKPRNRAGAVRSIAEEPARPERRAGAGRSLAETAAAAKEVVWTEEVSRAMEERELA